MTIREAIYMLFQKFAKLGETYKRERFMLSDLAFGINETKTLTYSVEKEGLVPVAVIAIAKSGAGSGLLAPMGWFASASNNTATVVLKNTHTAALSNISVEIAVLYQVL